MAYKNYLLTILLVILASNYMGETALGLLLQDIKVDLNLSDTQLGLLSGIAFALFYSIMGIPIARWADRGNRVTIIAVTTALWSGALALCALAGSFLQLLAIRVIVGVGEAGCVPPAHSLIASHFTREERPRAVARYMLGGPLSMIIGYFLAGWVNEFYGWRTTFVLLGLPGLVLAALALTSLKEPRKSGGAAHEPAASVDGSQVLQAPAGPSFKEVCVVLWSNATFRHLLFCFSIMSFFGAGIVRWLPAFFVRSFGLETGELGTWLAVIYGVGGLLGTYFGGEWATRHARANERLQLRATAVICSGFGIASAFIYLSPNHYVAFALLAVTSLGGSMIHGPLFATIQTLVPDRMRAMSIALLYLAANLIGLGLGPLAAGALSDLFRIWAGEESLRYALLALSPGYLWGAWHLWQASRFVRDDLQAAQTAGRNVATGCPAV
jgi:MFS transporter, Spinster family, sphingosine-1-phosphate transporter